MNANLVISTDRRFLKRETATSELLAAVHVDPKWAEYIKVLDSTDELALLHYITTLEPNTDRINAEIMSEIGHVRGIVVEKKTGQVVCRSFPYTPEIAMSDVDFISSQLPANLEGCGVYQACEGTVLRLFWYNDEWVMSTHRKIHARNSRWSGPTFGEMFDQVCNFDLDSLNKSFCYIFLISHPGNRVIYEIEQPQLLHLATYDRDNQCFVTVDQGVPMPTDLNITEHEKLVETVQELAQQRVPGVIVLPTRENPCPVKVVNDEYSKMRGVRGNEPSLRTRYLQLRGSPECKLLMKWYNDEAHKKTFLAAEREFGALAEKLHGLYMSRFIHKVIEQLPKEEFVTLQRCHAWHLENRANNIVTLVKVREMLGTTPSHFLMIMLNRQRQNRKRAPAEVAQD